MLASYIIACSFFILGSIASPVHLSQALESELTAASQNFNFGSHKDARKSLNSSDNVYISWSPKYKPLGRRARSIVTSPYGILEDRTTALAKRNQFSLTHYRTQYTVLPLSTAALYAKFFYDTVAHQAIHIWLSRPQLALLTVTQGPFQLTVSGLGSEIPWSLLAFIAQHLSAAATTGLVNTFDAYYTQSGTSITIAVSLRLIEGVTLVGPMSISPRERDVSREDKVSTAPIVSSLQRRASTGPSMQMIKFTSVNMLVPTALVASILEDFYNIIALKIETGQLADMLPAKEIVLSLWDFELSFSCMTMKIPLSFVYAYAVDMAKLTSMSWTGLYEATIQGGGPLSEVVILVKMKVKGT